MKRSKFLKQLSTALAVSLPLVGLATSCSDDPAAPSPPPSTDKDCLANGTSSAIGGNHGHELVVSKNDVENGVAKTYTITAYASHPHEVTISAANFVSLKNNIGISVTSTSGGGHTHSISVSCA